MGYFSNWIINKSTDTPKSNISSSPNITSILTKPIPKENNENNEKIIILDFENPQKYNDNKVIVEKVDNNCEITSNHKKSVDFKITKLGSETTYIYTDGACINNGKKNAKAGIGIFFSHNDSRNTSERLGGKQSNNCAELEAIIKAIKLAKPEIQSNHNIIIMTDSEYAIKCLTSYGRKLAAKNWETKNPIPNFHKVKYAYELFNKYPNISVQHIKAHTGKNDKHSIGNDMADKLAVAGIK